MSHRPAAFAAIVIAIANSLPLAACGDAPPAAYPSVRYEIEPFPPPAPRGSADAGADAQPR